MKKNILRILLGLLIIVGIFFFVQDNDSQIDDEQLLLEKTYSLSQSYVALRYKTNDVLLHAQSGDYSSWNTEMSSLIKAWDILRVESSVLQDLATRVSADEISFHLFPSVSAYDKQEITNVFDKAPAGKKIATLAKYLGVDAKRAFQILKQDQAQVEADAWNDAGDTFQKLETSATLIKDTCKVAGFVGGVIIAGGLPALASSSSLSQAAVIIAGADLTLEITDDGAKIALGNTNKLSAIINDVRKVTEPLSTILSINAIPNTLGKGIDKFNAVMLVLDQFRGAAQEGKIIGIELPVYSKSRVVGPVTTVVLQKNEVDVWLNELGKSKNNDTISPEDLQNILSVLEKEIKHDVLSEETLSGTKNNPILGDTKATPPVIGVWEGVIKSTPSANAQEEETDVSLLLNKDGTVTTTSKVDGFILWEQEGSLIRFYADPSHEDGYYEFELEGDTMVFIKVAGPDQEDRTKWVEILAGADFFGGKFFEITLKKQ